jgi:hypothetical protein
MQSLMDKHRSSIVRTVEKELITDHDIGIIYATARPSGEAFVAWYATRCPAVLYTFAGSVFDVPIQQVVSGLVEW